MGIVVAIAIIIFLWLIISMSNDLERSLVKVEEALSDIDVSLTKRYDVLTKMVDVVKSYQKYEQETLCKIIKLRKDMTLSEKSSVNRSMDEAFTKINALVENYPELKASENVKTLQLAIVDVEEHLQASRRLYNANVSNLNQKIASFPTNIIASMKWIESKEYFMAEEEKRENVEIDL